MISKSTWTISRNPYDAVHMVLWASLTAFVLYFIGFVMPKIPAAHARAEALRVHEILAENEFYCRKLGMGTRAPGHDQCILDLQAFRAMAEKRVLEETEPGF